MLDARKFEECARRAASAVQAIQTLPPGSVDVENEIEIRAALAVALFNCGAPVDQRTHVWLDVLTLATMSGNEEIQARALWSLWDAMVSGGEIHHALSYATRLQRFAEERGNRWQQTFAKLIIAISLHYQGHHSQVRARLEVILQHLSDHPEEGHCIGSFAIDARAICFSGLARIAWLQGETKEAMMIVDKIIDLVEPSQMEPWLTHLLAMVAVPLALQSGDYEWGSRYLGVLHSQATLHDFAIWRDYGACFAGYLDVKEGQTQRGIVALELSLGALVSRGYRRNVTPLIIGYAEALIAVGRLDEAIERMERTREFCRHHGELLYLPEVSRVLGLAVQAQADLWRDREDLQRKKRALAQAYFQEAIAIARSHGAATLELRAVKAFAHLLERQQHV